MMTSTVTGEKETLNIMLWEQMVNIELAIWTSHNNYASDSEEYREIILQAEISVIHSSDPRLPEKSTKLWLFDIKDIILFWCSALYAFSRIMIVSIAVSSLRRLCINLFFPIRLDASYIYICIYIYMFYITYIENIYIAYTY